MINKNVLNINPEIICLIIEKAKELHVKEEVTFDENIPNSEYEYDWAQILASHEDDQTYIEVKKTINELEMDQKIDLLALFYLGREDFDSTEWSAAHKEAKNNLLPNLSDYLLAQPLLSDYLEKGLEYLGYSCND